MAQPRFLLSSTSSLFLGQLSLLIQVFLDATWILHSVTVFWGPLLIMVGSYGLIGTSVWRHYRATAGDSEENSSAPLRLGRRLSVCALLLPSQ